MVFVEVDRKEGLVEGLRDPSKTLQMSVKTWIGKLNLIIR